MTCRKGVPALQLGCPSFGGLLHFLLLVVSRCCLGRCLRWPIRLTLPRELYAVDGGQPLMPMTSSHRHDLLPLAPVSGSLPSRYYASSLDVAYCCSVGLVFSHRCHILFSLGTLLIASAMAKRGFCDCAVATLLAFDSLLRVSELVGILVRDVSGVSDPRRGLRASSSAIHSSPKSCSSSTGVSVCLSASKTGFSCLVASDYLGRSCAWRVILWVSHDFTSLLILCAMVELLMRICISTSPLSWLCVEADDVLMMRFPTRSAAASFSDRPRL